MIGAEDGARRVPDAGRDDRQGEVELDADHPAVEVDHEGRDVHLDLKDDEDLDLEAGGGSEAGGDLELDDEVDAALVEALDVEADDVEADDQEADAALGDGLDDEVDGEAEDEEADEGAGEQDAETGGVVTAPAGAGTDRRVRPDEAVAVGPSPGAGGSPLENGQRQAGFAIPLDPDVPDHDPGVRLRRDLEAILLVADQPVTAASLAAVLERPVSHVEDVLVELAAEYAGDQRGFVLRAVAGGWRLYTHPASHAAVDAYMRAGTQQRLTQAALETLAVIAYRQPVTRAHVAAVRGVNVDGVLRTLLSRGLVAEVGRDEGPGQAVLYGTTPLFLEQLGLNAVHELPPVADYLPEGVDLSGLEENW